MIFLKNDTLQSWSAIGQYTLNKWASYYANIYLFWGDNNQEITLSDSLKNVLSASTNVGSVKMEVLVPKAGTFLLSHT